MHRFLSVDLYMGSSDIKVNVKLGFTWCQGLPYGRVDLAGTKFANSTLEDCGLTYAVRKDKVFKNPRLARKRGDSHT
jgi:hypothetical protein